LLALVHILFDILDLDGSNFLRWLTPVEQSLIVAEVVPSGEFLDSSDVGFWLLARQRFSDRSADFNPLV
jgi:hypothetical protein